MSPRHLRRIACALALAALAAAASAQAPAPAPYTFVAEWTIARDQWAGYADWTARQHKPILERAAADGRLLDWGIYETYVHEEGRPTHGIWWTAASLANLEKVRLELLKAPAHPAAMAAPHHDFLLRAAMGNGKSATLTGAFLYVNMQEVRAGREQEWKAAWEKYFKPVYDELVANGTLASWAIHGEAVHTQPASMRWIATIAPSAEAQDAADAALAAARAKMSDADRQQMQETAREVGVPESHRDYLAKVSAGWIK